jgi:aminopeptidase N
VLKSVSSFSILLILIFSINLFSQHEHHRECAKTKAESAAKWMSKEIKATDNQNSYDALHYVIDIDFQPVQENIIGHVDATVKVINGPLSKIELDFSSNMSVDSVYHNGVKTTYTHSGNIVGVNLTSPVNSNETTIVSVYYHGRPQASGLGSFGFDSYQGKPLIWSLSEPYGAREWWPCKDIPGDKADSVLIRFTVPDPMIVASNGLLVEEIKDNGKTTFVWREKYPIPTYLVSIAAYEYKKYYDFYVTMEQDTMPLEFYVAPEHYENSKNRFLEVDEMIEIFADMFGEYPFVKEKYGHAEFPWGGGMEHQTISSLGNIKWSGGNYSQGLIAHELAHQWWGDMISCGSFHHIWINEGFATYSEALLVEALYGVDAYHNQMNNEAYYGGGSIYVADTTNTNRIFSGSLSYAKGSYVLHMLRHVLGSDTFFDVLKAYGSDYRFRFGTAKTEDFQLVCEEVSGMKLDKFFQQWIYGERHPVYAFGYSVEEITNGYRLNLEIDQVQDNTGLFWMPIDIEVTTASGKQTFVVWDSLQTQSFTFELSEEPLNVALDPDNWILKKTQEKLVNPSFDNGVLVVNGLDWSIGEDVVNAYSETSFWGNSKVDFWDLFDEPADGYPASIINAKGNGPISISQLGRYSTILWLSQKSNGDLDIWNNLPIMEYLNAGGNLILVTRMGMEFLDDEMTDYLGIDWGESNRKFLKNSISATPDMIDMNLLKNHSFVDLFNTELTKDYSTLLFTTDEDLSEPKGMGVHAKPENKGEFIYIAGRPYLFDHNDLRTNMQFILQNYFGALTSVEDEISSDIPTTYSLNQNYPNPFNPSTVISYSLPENSNVTIKLFDILGNEVAVLVDEAKSAGRYELSFDAGNLTSGIYFYQIKADNFFDTKKMLLVK